MAKLLNRSRSRSRRSTMPSMGFGFGSGKRNPIIAVQKKNGHMLFAKKTHKGHYKVVASQNVTKPSGKVYRENVGKNSDGSKSYFYTRDANKEKTFSDLVNKHASKNKGVISSDEIKKNKNMVYSNDPEGKDKIDRKTALRYSSQKIPFYVHTSKTDFEKTLERNAGIMKRSSGRSKSKEQKKIEKQYTGIASRKTPQVLY